MNLDLLGWTPADSTDTRHETTDQKGTQLRGGAAAPDPAAYGLSPPLFQPLTTYAAHGRIFPAPARGIPHPGGRAISVPLAPVTSGSPRSPPGTSSGRSGHIEARIVQLPKLDSTTAGIGN
jgi:hypothetical protein